MAKGRRTPLGAAEQKASNHLLVGLGVGIITTVTGFSIAGTYTAINAMNRESDEALAATQALATERAAAEEAAAIAAAQQEAAEQEQENVNSVVGSNKSGENDEPEYYSDQIAWMQENHIKFDEYGLPVDDDGNLVDDPTTDVYDPARMAYFFDDNGDAKSPLIDTLPSNAEEAGDLGGGPLTGIVNPEVETLEDGDPVVGNAGSSEEDADTEGNNGTAVDTSKWWFDENGNLLPGLQLDENEKPIYIVKSGDCLSAIGDRYGFSYNEIAQASGKSDPNILEVGEVLHFPDTRSGTGSNVISGEAAPGRG